MISPNAWAYGVTVLIELVKPKRFQLLRSFSSVMYMMRTPICLHCIQDAQLAPNPTAAFVIPLETLYPIPSNSALRSESGGQLTSSGRSGGRGVGKMQHCSPG